MIKKTGTVEPDHLLIVKSPVYKMYCDNMYYTMYYTVEPDHLFIVKSPIYKMYCDNMYYTMYYNVSIIVAN